MKNKKETYLRLARNMAQEIAALRIDSDEKLRERLNKKFKKYMNLAGFQLQQNGPTSNSHN